MNTGIEALGYTASFFIVMSLCMSNMKLLRWFNMTGAFLCALYGLLKPAYPVMLLNGIITLINIYHLYRIRTERINNA